MERDHAEEYNADEEKAVYFRGRIAGGDAGSGNGAKYFVINQIEYDLFINRTIYSFRPGLS